MPEPVPPIAPIAPSVATARPTHRLRVAVLTGLSLAVSGAAAGAAELKVVATIKPIHALVAQVMEGVGSPALLVQGAASPHSYALKPSDARALNGADVVFRVSETVEPFTRKITASLPKTVRIETLADSPGIELLALRTGETFESHDHHHDHHDHHGHGDHGHEGHGHDHHDHGAHKYDDHAHDHHSDPAHAPATSRDGHVWLDPANARRMVTQIASVLSQAAPDHAAAFAANADRANKRLETLEADVARELAPVKGKPFIVFHDAYQYFEHRFDLAAVGSITLSPEAQPSAKRLTEIRRKLAKLSAACVFAEPQFKPKLVAAVTEGTSARSGTLDPEGALLEPGPDAYETLIRNLAGGLKSCLLQGS